MPRRKNNELKILKDLDRNDSQKLDDFYSKFFDNYNYNDGEFELRDMILKEHGYDVVIVKQQAMQEMNKKITDILNFKVKPPLSFEESDQSPLSGEASQLLRYQWATGMDYCPHDPRFFYLSPWLKTLYSGDYEGMMKILEDKSDAEIVELLKARETLYNIPAIFHVIIGARNLAEVIPEKQEMYRMTAARLKVKREWVKILRKLIALGADVSSRDIAGFTPLHHCVQHHGNEVTLSMAEILIEAGADVNSQCRLGDTPLLDCTRAQKFDFMKVLLSHGANHYTPDNDGCSPWSLTSRYPKVQRMFGEANKKRFRELREKMKDEAGGSLRSCSLCQVTGPENKKCTGCFFVYYCSQHCQRQDWTRHKEDCKKIRGEFKDCVVDLQSYSGRSHLSNKFYVRRTGDLPQKSHFVAKVQVPLSEEIGSTVDEAGHLYIYSKDRKIVGMIEPACNEEVHRELVNKTVSEGCDGLKAFFYATFSGPIRTMAGKESITIQINTARILPVETW